MVPGGLIRESGTNWALGDWILGRQLAQSGCGVPIPQDFPALLGRTVSEQS